MATLTLSLLNLIDCRSLHFKVFLYMLAMIIFFQSLIIHDQSFLLLRLQHLTSGLLFLWPEREVSRETKLCTIRTAVTETLTTDDWACLLSGWSPIDKASLHIHVRLWPGTRCQPASGRWSPISPRRQLVCSFIKVSGFQTFLGGSRVLLCSPLGAVKHLPDTHTVPLRPHWCWPSYLASLHNHT